jgi:protein-S-isoprenylcysteine O-methyltransferase Ste14
VAIFLPAWSLNYWQGWLFFVTFASLTVGTSLYFIKHDPALVRRRIDVGAKAETEPTQKPIMAFNSVAMIVTVILAPLDHRLQWSNVPGAISAIALAIVVLGYGLTIAALINNTYAAATIRIEPHQPVVSHGLYAWMRHPMYTGSIVMFIAMPVALGSYWGLITAAGIAGGIIWRLLDEERVLAARLPGYDDYCRKVRWRLVPGLW